MPASSACAGFRARYDGCVRVERLRGAVAHFVLPALALFAGIVAVLALLAVTISPAFLAGASPALLLGVFYALHRSTRPREPVAEGELTLRGDHVYVGARLVAHRSKLEGAVVVPHAPEGTLVRLVGRRAVDLRVEDVASGRAAVEALRFDAAHATAAFIVRASDIESYRRRLRWIVLWVLLPVALFLLAGALRSPAVAALALVGFLGMLVSVLALSSSRRCVVGTDGVLLTGFGAKDFVPIARIGEVEVDTVDLVLGNRARVVRLFDKGGLPLREILVDAMKDGPFQEGIHAAIDARAESLAERIREAQAVETGGGLVDERTLARDARPWTEWVSTLRGLSHHAATFRGGEPPRPEALLALVEDPTVAAWKRAAAAVAVSRTSAAKKRLRVVAAASAEPRLRVALEAAVEEDEARMADALEALEREPARRR